MTETLQLKYLLNKYALETDKQSVIDVVRLTSPDRYNNFCDIYDNRTKDGLATATDNSLIITGVTNVALKEQLMWSGGSTYTNFEKARFKESANGNAFGWGSRNFTQETWGVANDKHMSKYDNSNLFEQQFDNPNSLENFSSVASMFLPTLVGRTAEGRLYDVLSDYTSKSQFSYNPISQPVYMKKRTVATFIGTDRNGTYKVAWQDVSDHAIASPEKIASSAKITGGISNTYLSEYYTPTIVYDTNAFTTSNSPKLNKSDKSVSEAQYTLTLNLSGMDSARGNNTYKFNKKSDLTNVLKYAKGFWHNDDMIGLANYYIPFSMYLNQVEWAKVQNISILDSSKYSQSEKISEKFTDEKTDPIKLVGVSDNSGSLVGVKLSLDASALVNDSSIKVIKSNSSTVNDLSQAGVSKISVNKAWVENVIESKITEEPRLEYPIGGYKLEKNSGKLFLTNLILYRALIGDAFNWSSQQQIVEPGIKKFEFFPKIFNGESVNDYTIYSLVHTVWPDQTFVYVDDDLSGSNEDNNNSQDVSGEVNSEENEHTTPNNISSLIKKFKSDFNRYEIIKASGVVTQGLLTRYGGIVPELLAPKKWRLQPSISTIIGGMRPDDLYIGNERYYSTADLTVLRDSLVKQTGGAANIAKVVNFNIDTTLRVRKDLVSSQLEYGKTYTPNWGLSQYKAVASNYGKVASVIYSQNTVALTTENAQIKVLEKEPVGVALVSNRPQVITSSLRAYKLTAEAKESETNIAKRYTIIDRDSSRTQGVETVTFGNVTLRTGQMGTGYIGKVFNREKMNYEYLTEEIHNGASLALDKQNVVIDTISNYDYLITDPKLINTKVSGIIPKSSSKQNGSVYVKTAGFTSEIYDKYAESATAAIRFSSNAAKLCQVYNNEQTSLGIHNANLGLIKQTTYERIKLSTTHNLSDDDATVLENKINITAGGYRYKPSTESVITGATMLPDRIVYKSCSLELTQDDVFVTIGKTMYSLNNLFKVLKRKFSTDFDRVVVSSSNSKISGNRPISGYEGTTGLSSGVAASELRNVDYDAVITEIIWTTFRQVQADGSEVGNYISTRANAISAIGNNNKDTLDYSKFMAGKTTMTKNTLSGLDLDYYTYETGSQTITWYSDAPNYEKDENRCTWPAVRTIKVQRTVGGLLKIVYASDFKLGDKPYTGGTQTELENGETANDPLLYS